MKSVNACLPDFLVSLRGDSKDIRANMSLKKKKNQAHKCQPCYPSHVTLLTYTLMQLSFCINEGEFLIKIYDWLTHHVKVNSRLKEKAIMNLHSVASLYGRLWSCCNVFHYADGHFCYFVPLLNTVYINEGKLKKQILSTKPATVWL